MPFYCIPFRSTIKVFRFTTALVSVIMVSQHWKEAVRMATKKSLQWLRLDNAAKIYPAARNNNWSNIFRLSATLTESIDTQVLSKALELTVQRIPSIASRLRRGLFWYYLEQVPHAPSIREEASCPLLPMPKWEARKCAFRVIVYNRRIAVEFFHSLTDGNGGLVFLKTLVAEYLHQKYGIAIEASHGILDCTEAPKPEEMEDSFLKYAGPVAAGRGETNAFRLSGTPEPDNFRHLVCVQIPVQQILEAAHKHGVSITTYLCAAMMQAILEIQKAHIPWRRFRKPVKVQIPVDLRRLFPSRSLRNFALYVNTEADPRLGDYDFHELCMLVHHQMGLKVTQKQMGSQIAANVQSERSALVRIMPLFLKNIALKMVFKAVGERKICLSLSNLGRADLPEAMQPYVERMDFILAPQSTAPHNSGVISYNDTLYFNFIRNIQEPELEASFCRVLQQQGLSILVESNGRI